LIFWVLIFDWRGRLVLARESGLASAVRQQGKFNFGSAIIAAKTMAQSLT
jgi:hypothetical protein